MTRPAPGEGTGRTGPVPSPEAVRAQLAEWVRARWDPGMPLRDWRGLLLDSGWAVPSWPRRWHGRDLPAWADELVAGELVRLGAVGTPVGSGTWLAAPTILAHGTDDLRERLLRPILTGEQTWCQLFSEPGAGSDLAGLSTSAVLDGDSWVINGQKLWSTSAHHADMGMLLARTDSHVPKHQGISYFAIPMRQPGVQVRPLRQMNFHASFNEVFLTGARVPRDNVIGGVGQGWTVALTTLAYERRFAALRRPEYSPGPGRALDEARAESDDHFATYSWYPQRAGRADLVIAHAHAAGVSSDPVIRQAVARVVTLQRVSAWTSERARASRRSGTRPGAEGSIGKLAASNLARECARVHSMIAAASGLVTGPDSALRGVSGGRPPGEQLRGVSGGRPPGEELRGVIAEVLLSVPAQSIAGGTDEIQRNILAERVLGLPGEVRLDRDVPFNRIPGRG